MRLINQIKGLKKNKHSELYCKVCRVGLRVIEPTRVDVLETVKSLEVGSRFENGLVVSLHILEQLLEGLFINLLKLEYLLG